jgi:hypothetical protein
VRVNIIALLLFCSLVLVAASLVLFVFSARQGDCVQAERLCLLPLEQDDAEPAARAPTNHGPDAPSGGAAGHQGTTHANHCQPL